MPLFNDSHRCLARAHPALWCCPPLVLLSVRPTFGICTMKLSMDDQWMCEVSLERISSSSASTVLRVPSDAPDDSRCPPVWKKLLTSAPILRTSLRVQQPEGGASLLRRSNAAGTYATPPRHSARSTRAAAVRQLSHHDNNKQTAANTARAAKPQGPGRRCSSTLPWSIHICRNIETSYP